MSGARTKEAIALEQEDNTWTCKCGHVNPMSSFQRNRGGKTPCEKTGCDIITDL